MGAVGATLVIARPFALSLSKGRGWQTPDNRRHNCRQAPTEGGNRNAES